MGPFRICGRKEGRSRRSGESYFLLRISGFVGCLDIGGCGGVVVVTKWWSVVLYRSAAFYSAAASPIFGFELGRLVVGRGVDVRAVSVWVT